MDEAVASSERGMEMEKKESSSSDLVEERFPPRMALRVLLVEADDSTRQIITALLRKCSYRVSAVPDGLKAWETLKRRPHDVDLILTEVELPLISGYALLTLIMEHDICKNIPIIMMSSQDSISIVLKCMLKGTADFLIKPVRKNELRTLWQHVWRRQTKIVGNVPGNRAVKQQKVEVSSENNASSNYSIDYLDSDPKNKECSEKGSDAQGLSQLKWGSGFNSRNTEPEECMALVEKSVMPKSEIGGKSIGIEPGSASCNEPFKSNAFMYNGGVFSRKVNLDVDLGPGSLSGHVDNNVEVNFHAIDLGDPSSGALDLIGKFDCRPKDTCRNLSANDETNKFSFIPELELSLRRFQHIYPKNEDTGEGHVLNHSDASAFSRYDDSKASWPFFPTLTSNSTELKEGPTTFYNELSDHSPESTVGTISQGASLSCQENMSTLFNGQSGHSETAFPGPQMGFIPIPGVKFDSFSPGYRQKFPPIIYTESGFPPLWSATGQREHSPFLMSSSFHSSSEIDNSEQTVRDETTDHSGGQSAREGDKDSVKVEREGSAAPGLSGIGSICEGIAENMCGGCDSDATPSTSAVRSSVSDSVNDSRLFIRDGSRGINAHCSSQREAALMKFRLKRKDRCFEKKVRYQSRKRLAEQRPRVKGQFVRQVQTEPSPPES